MVRVWDVQSGEQVKRVAGHSGAVLSLQYSPDGKFFASASADKTVRIWNAATKA